MATISVRRLKDRGDAGGKITASMPTKALAPFEEKLSSASARKSAGKENPNPRSISRFSGPAQKPAMRSMPRLSTGEGEPRSRPRGRSPSPSDFTRILSDLRKTRISSNDTLRHNGMSGGSLVGSGEKGLSGSKDLEKKGFRESGHRFSEERMNGFREKENGIAAEKSKNSDQKVVGEESAVDKLFSGKYKKMDALPMNYLKSNVNGVQNALGGSTDQCNKDGNFRSIGNVMDHKGENWNQNAILKLDHASIMEMNETKMSFKESGFRNMSNLKRSDVCKEKGVNEGKMNVRVAKKHADKLQEKLAYLEGKVKKIASDITKTKEILDTNNTDASKVMLLNIQEKISGIEQAMGSAIADFNMHINSDCSGNLDNSKSTGTDMVPVHGANQHKQAEPAKLLVKSLSGEDLEARLFPHHKFLRNQPSMKLPAFRSQSNRNNVLESNNRSNSENPMSPIDENLITIEFLASLNKDQSCVSGKDARVIDEVQETEDTETSTVSQSSNSFGGKQNTELDLQADERLDDFDERENKASIIVEGEIEDDSVSQLIEIGRKTSTGGWFVSEGESILLAHDDGSCSFYDVANQEEKAEYRPPAGITKDLWKDCWIIRAPGADGCSGKYVVAASAGNTRDSGFCTWDFYSKEIGAFHTEDNKTTSRIALGPLCDNIYRRNALADVMSYENCQWWYRPCGPLIVSTASCQRALKVFDIRDGEQIMKWNVQKPVLAMDYCSPLQWRNRGKVVVAETEAVSLWDVNSQNPHALLSVSTSGHRISALHVNNTDAELGGGVRQRVSSSEAEGNDGVFCTADSINVFDFRHPSGIGLKIPKIGVSVESLSSRGDSVFLGCSNVSSATNKQASSQVLQFSLRKQGIINAYQLPESSAHPHSHHKALIEVWGNSDLVMAVCGLGLFVFDALRDDGSPSFAIDYSSPQKAKEVIGPDDLYMPSFDYLSSQILLISRDRPAMWRHLS